MEVDQIAEEAVIPTSSEVLQEDAQTEQTANKKKKKIRPYHRIHAHRNPLSDAPME